jgi:uncharacterized protein (TIRG00374 family)
MVTEREDRTEAEGRKKSSLAWRIARIGISAAIVVGIFAYAIPQVADYSAVWSIIRDLTPIELWSLIAATFLNLVTYWLVNMSALPGLTFWRSAILTQTTTSVANTIPAGGAVAVGLSYTILASWGFDAQAVALYVGVTGVWNTLMKLALPVVALAFVALSGDASAALVTAACAGLVMLVIALTVFALLLWKEVFARRIGDGLQRVVSAVRKPFGRPALEGWGDAAVDFRNRMIKLVARRWIPLTLTTIASHLALWLVLLMSLRHVGVSEQEVSTATTLAVFAFGRLITALPVTPGGVGVVELGYIGGLVAAGGPRPEVVAAVLLFRALTYVVQIPIGGFTYLLWRAEQRRAERATATA